MVSHSSKALLFVLGREAPIIRLGRASGGHLCGLLVKKRREKKKKRKKKEKRKKQARGAEVRGPLPQPEKN